jgi:hypothetical protein
VVPAQHSTGSGIAVGSVTAAATTGALLAMGHRLGSAGIPFASISAALLHRTASTAAVGLVFAGVVLHAAATFVWSMMYVWLVRHIHWRVGAAAIAVGSGAFVVSWLVAWSTGSGVASVLPLGDRLVLAVVFAGALVVGMRFAFPVSQSA